MTETTVDSTLQLEGLVPGTWMIDPAHSEVGFTVRHLMSKVRGQFRTFEGSLQIAADALQSSVRRRSHSAPSTPAAATATTT